MVAVAIQPVTAGPIKELNLVLGLAIRAALTKIPILVINTAGIKITKF